MNRSNPEPDVAALMRHRRDVANVRETLRARWLFQSKNPAVAALEANRNAILALLQSSDQLIESLIAPTEPHFCDRPEDCSHPDCRAQADAWALSHHGLLIAAGHPKADPYPSERELSRGFAVEADALTDPDDGFWANNY